jgi:hypothetical protein
MWLKLHLMCGVKTNIVTSVTQYLTQTTTARNQNCGLGCITSTRLTVLSFYSITTSGPTSKRRST